MCRSEVRHAVVVFGEVGREVDASVGWKLLWHHVSNHKLLFHKVFIILLIHLFIGRQLVRWIHDALGFCCLGLVDQLVTVVSRPVSGLIDAGTATLGLLKLLL